MMNEFEKLENALLRAGREMEYPATPAIAARVRTALTREVSSSESVVMPRNWWRVLVPLAAALILALALLFAIPNTREAIGQFLGLRGLQIFYVTPTPTALPTLTPRPSPTAAVTSVGETLNPPMTETPRATATPRPTRTPTAQPFTLCCEMTLAEAQRRARFNLLVPPNEAPSKVYYLDIFNNGEQVVMVFGDPKNPRMTLFQMQRWVYGKIVGRVFEKQVPPQAVIDETQVNGERALWFSGAPHRLVVLDQYGEPVPGSARTVDANTLVWETGDEDRGIVYRIETKAALKEAVQIAESLQEVKP